MRLLENPGYAHAASYVSDKFRQQLLHIYHALLPPSFTFCYLELEAIAEPRAQFIHEKPIPQLQLHRTARLFKPLTFPPTHCTALLAHSQQQQQQQKKRRCFGARDDRWKCIYHENEFAKLDAF